MSPTASCPIAPFDQAPDDYGQTVDDILTNPHAYFKSFGPEAREFQSRHRSERLRTMTLVAPAAELVNLRPLLLCLDRAEIKVASWQEAFAQTAARLGAAHPETFVALQEAGGLEWMDCPADGAPFAERLADGTLRPSFPTMEDVIRSVQWLFLMCGIRLNEVIVQVDPYDDESWELRREELRRKRDEERVFMQGRRAAQRAWAAEHPEG